MEAQEKICIREIMVERNPLKNREPEQRNLTKRNGVFGVKQQEVVWYNYK